MTADARPRRSDQRHPSPVRFSICTLVTDHVEYAEMVQSFRAGGFDAPDCEYLYLDNSEGNVFDAFRGGNIFLREAAGDYIILCHQDLLLLNDNRDVLQARLVELDAKHPDWALCGNAGGTASGDIAVRITDPHGVDQTSGAFPARATALDENFILIRREANLALSHDLTGFHLYGADLCIIADVLGRSAWVIDFHLRHKSPGNANAQFIEAKRAVSAKYERAFRRRLVTTTCTTFMVAGAKRQPILRRIFSRYG